MRLFGGERMQNLMDTLKVDEDMPIEAKLLSSSIESAQSRVEGRNFQTRKNVLQFDDVMNRQREIIYGQRSQVLEGEDIGPTITRMFEESLDAAIDRYMPESYDPADYNIPGLIEHFSGVVLPPDDPRFTEKALRALSRQQVRELLYAQASGLYAQRTAQWGDTLRAEIERVVLLRCVDRHWMEHIDNMDQLRRGIYLRSYGQRDPVVEYRIEGFEMFDEMIAAIREDTVRGLLTVRIQLEAPVQREQVMQPIPNRPAVPPPRAVAARPPVTR